MTERTYTTQGIGAHAAKLPQSSGTRKFLANLGRAVLFAVVLGGGAAWASAKVTEYRIAQLEEDMQAIQHEIRELTIEVRTLITEVKRYHEESNRVEQQTKPGLEFAFDAPPDWSVVGSTGVRFDGTQRATDPVQRGGW